MQILIIVLESAWAPLWSVYDHEAVNFHPVMINVVHGTSEPSDFLRVSVAPHRNSAQTFSCFPDRKHIHTNFVKVLIIRCYGDDLLLFPSVHHAGMVFVIICAFWGVLTLGHHTLPEVHCAHPCSWSTLCLIFLTHMSFVPLSRSQLPVQ